MGFYPRNISLYHQALLHKSSMIRAKDGKAQNNERLEFLGDAVLDLVIAHLVYEHFEGRSEGFLTNTRAKIVQRETLNKLAVKIGLDRMLKSEMHLYAHNNYLYGNAFEAFIGAIYLDRGYEKCKEFIQTRIIREYIDLDKLSRKEMNFKSRLIEWGQKNKFKIEFNLLSQEQDSSGSPVFQTEIRVENISLGEGIGYSKKESQQAASKISLNAVKNKTLVVQIQQAKEERLSQNGEMETDLIEENLPTDEQEDAVLELSETDAHPLSLDN